MKIEKKTRLLVVVVVAVVVPTMSGLENTCCAHNVSLREAVLSGNIMDLPVVERSVFWAHNVVVELTLEAWDRRFICVHT